MARNSIVFIHGLWMHSFTLELLITSGEKDHIVPPVLARPHLRNTVNLRQ
jgi:hypothetical protein